MTCMRFIQPQNVQVWYTLSNAYGGIDMAMARCTGKVLERNLRCMRNDVYGSKLLGADQMWGVVNSPPKSGSLKALHARPHTRTHTLSFISIDEGT